MRVEYSDGDYLFFINSRYIKELDYTSKEEIGKYIKEMLLLYKKIYNIELSGFYDANVYLNEKVGMYIEINKDKKYDFYKDEVNLKISIYYDKCFYFKTYMYEVISKYKWKFINDYYYVKVDDINSDDIINLVEYGNFVYDETN